MSSRICTEDEITLSAIFRLMLARDQTVRQVKAPGPLTRPFACSNPAARLLFTAAAEHQPRTALCKIGGWRKWNVSRNDGYADARRAYPSWHRGDAHG